MSDNESNMEEFLRQLLGEQAARAAMESMRARGIDPESLNSQFPDPYMMKQALTQFTMMMNGPASGPVDWKSALQVAHTKSWDSKETAVTAAQAQRTREALSVADLWLDAVVEFGPGNVNRQVWTRSEWIDGTAEVWKRICEPVAANVAQAFESILDEQQKHIADIDPSLSDSVPDISSLLNSTRDILPKMSSFLFASQIGMALGQIAQSALGSTDVGIPLADGSTTALVARNIEDFADELEIPFEEVLQFIALRECAHHRLFAGVPWLAGDLTRAVERYAQHIAIDSEAVAEAATRLDPANPEFNEDSLNEQIFAAAPTPEQRAALERVENLLALIEGWVDVVTSQAARPYLPHLEQLRELMRRRRALGGPVEKILGSLIGLKMRPRRARDAAKLFQLVTQDEGSDAREKLWAHPDLIPNSNELDSPETFVALRRAEAEASADIDQALESLLDGSMGWAEGLDPTIDPEADTLRKAGFDIGDASEGEGNTSDDDQSSGNGAESQS